MGELIATVIISGSSFASSGVSQCVQVPGNYEGYHVAEIQITSPLDFFPAAKFGLARLRESLPIRSGDAFDAAKYSAGAGVITRYVRSSLVDGFSAMRFVATVGHLENCGAKTIEVHYTVYTALIPPFGNRPFEERQDELQKPATTAGKNGSWGRFLLVPDFGYNHTRRVYSGGSFDFTLPVSIFDHGEVTGLGSSRSLFGRFALTSSRIMAKKYLATSEWGFDSKYSDTPAGVQNLKQAMLSLHFFASTKGLINNQLLVHYGASLAGGHQQGPIQDSPNSSLGSIKLLIGMETRKPADAFALSYGFQLGTIFSGHLPDFVKHVIDVRYSTGFAPLPRYLKQRYGTDDRPNFIGKDHHLVAIEAHANAGLIQTFGLVPGVERFFGGNRASAPFIEGQPWDVRAQPYIRSIPENTLGSASSVFGIGGTGFYALNVTVSKVLFGKALLPKQLGTSDFVSSLDFGIDTAKGELADTYFDKDPSILVATADVQMLEDRIDAIRMELSTLPLGSTNPGAITQVLTELKSSITIASLTANAILKSTKANQTSIFLNREVPRIESGLERLNYLLIDPIQSSTSRHIAELRDSLESAREELASHWTTVETREARSRANAHAQQDFSTAEKVLNTILYEVNAYSIAPTAILDVARVWPTSIGTHYAVGGGARVSIVNANFTVGYAVNPNRARGEGAGAVFFSIDVTDLFH